MVLRRPFVKRFLLVAVTLMVTHSTALAGWDEFVYKIKRAYHRNNAWPDPFNEVDARQVIQPFEQMKANGWQLHNTISHELFREGDGVLTSAGNEKIRYIATQAPVARRNVFVLRGKSKRETDLRLASVRDSLGSIETQGQPVGVFLTDKQPSAFAGAWAVKVSREYLEHLPLPKLPELTASGQEAAAEDSEQN